MTARLTLRELQVLTLLSFGKRGKDLASDLGIAPETMKHHVSNMRRKLQASNTAHAVAVAMRAGVLK